MQNYHVITHNGHWDLKIEGGERATLTRSTKEQLLGDMEQFMIGKTASVKIHRENGTIEEERTYPRGSDPVRSEG